MNEREEDILHDAGIRPTPNRILVLRALLEARRPLGLQELEEELPSVEKSSIFRVLATLMEQHLLHGVEDGRGITKYEFCRSDSLREDDDAHPHFYCTECRRIYCLHSESLPAVNLPEGFEAESVNYMIKGLCPDCSRRR